MADLRITKKLSDNVFTVVPEVINLTSAEDALQEDFGEPTVVIGGTFDVTSTTKPLTISGLTGTFQVGEVVTDDGGTPGSGKVFAVEAGTVWVKDITAAFNAAATLTGSSSGATATIDSVGSSITQFEQVYGSAPQSTTNFTTPQLTRRLPSGLPVTFSFDGDVISEAEENADDLALQIRIKIFASWTDFKSQVNNYESVNDYALP